MKQSEIEIDQQLKPFFELLVTVPERNPQAAAHTRSTFLNQARALQQMPVSKLAEPHRKIWEHSFFQMPVVKEHSRMIQAIVAILVSIALLLGGGGAAYTVQNSLPGDTVYPLKTLVEQIQLSLASQSQERLDLLQKLVDRRMEEMVLLQYQKQPVPAETALLMSEQMDAMLNLVVELPDQEMQQALTQISTHAQMHDMIVGQFADQSDGVAAQMRLRLREQIRLANMAQSDPQGFRNTVRQRFQNRYGQGSATETPGPDPSNTPGSNGKGPDATPSPQGYSTPANTSVGPMGPNTTPELGAGNGGSDNGGVSDNGVPDDKGSGNDGPDDKGSDNDGPEDNDSGKDKPKDTGSDKDKTKIR